jgi:PKD repeat protein
MPLPHCGGQVASVRVECGGQPNCFAVKQNFALDCCGFSNITLRGLVPRGALTPTHLTVIGVAYACPGNSVVIQSGVTAPFGPISVDPVTGDFAATLIPLTTALNCDDPVTVTVRCDPDNNCSATVTRKLDCPDCFRASVAVAYGTCTGTPPVQPVTLTASIELRAGDSKTFRWDFGDGTFSPTFPISNAAGTASTIYTHPETHNYAPGTYQAKLEVQPPLETCTPIVVNIKATCGSNCPTVTLDPPQVATQCVNGKRTVTLPYHITAGSQIAVCQWDFGDSQLGSAFVVNPGAATNAQEQHDYAPGTYTATLKIVLPGGCIEQSVTVQVAACPTVQCSLVVLDILLPVGGCDPMTGTRLVTGTAVLNSNDPSDVYYWQWDANPVTTGLSAPQATTQSHQYPAPGMTPTVYDVTLTVVRGGNCFSSKTKQVSVDGCGGPCPSITDIVASVSTSCTSDLLRRAVTLDATVVGAASVTQYRWDFGDGQSAILPGANGPNVVHEYAPGTYTATLTVIGPGTCQTSSTKSVTVAPCCPQLTGISTTSGNCSSAGNSRATTLTAQFNGTGFQSFDWDFGDGTTAMSSSPVSPPHDYTAPGSFTATVTAHAPNCPDSTTTATINVAGCGGPPPTTSPTCAILLWLAVIFGLVGAIVSIVGCVLAHFFPQAGLIVGIIGVVIFLIGVILFIIWWIVCRFITACQVILAVRDFVTALIFVFGIIAAILGLIGIAANDILLCAAAAVIYGFCWGVVLALLNMLAEQVKCLIRNPSGMGSGSASSSSGLSSSDANYRQRGGPLRKEALPVAGLGDLVSRATAAMGIQPCAPCQRRAAKLNAAIPFGTR